LHYGAEDYSVIKALTPRQEIKYQVYNPNVEKFAGDAVPADMVIIEVDGPSPSILPMLCDVVLFALFHGKINRRLPTFMWNWDLQTAQVVGEDLFYVVAYAKPKPLVEAA